MANFSQLIEDCRVSPKGDPRLMDLCRGVGRILDCRVSPKGDPRLMDLCRGVGRELECRVSPRGLETDGA